MVWQWVEKCCIIRGAQGDLRLTRGQGTGKNKPLFKTQKRGSPLGFRIIESCPRTKRNRRTRGGLFRNTNGNAAAGEGLRGKGRGGNRGGNL